ncbi:MAG TPA: UrcA family protein [Steroidobacteraceae bacterium]|jgi:UrcA family protein|nr:UrcA family protein [Steroidobacteraceae bacterium]
MSRNAHSLTTLAALTLASFAAAAGAAPSADAPPSTTVRYADLNLQSPEGVATLYRRLTAAASQVCPLAYTPDLHTQELSKQCQRAAIERAVTAIGNPMLARVATDHGISND